MRKCEEEQDRDCGSCAMRKQSNNYCKNCMGRTECPIHDPSLSYDCKQCYWVPKPLLMREVIKLWHSDLAVHCPKCTKKEFQRFVYDRYCYCCTNCGEHMYHENKK